MAWGTEAEFLNGGAVHNFQGVGQNPEDRICHVGGALPVLL